MLEIKLYKSHWKAIRIIVFCSLFIICFIFLLEKTNSSKFLAWLGICFFSLGYPVGFSNLFDRRPQIIINENGIFDRTTRIDLVNWSFIKDAYAISIYRQKFICLVTDTSFKISYKKNFFNREAVKFNESIGAQEINISLGQIQIDSRKLLELIQKMIQADLNSQERIDIIKKYVA